MLSSKKTCLIGLFGTGIQQSRAPEIHMRTGERYGVRCVYRLIDFDALGLDSAALPDLLCSAERMGFDGLAVTHPYKQDILSFLTELSPDAAALGAVNTVVLQNGRRIGHNTDWLGFAQSMQVDMAGVALGRVVQLGAGGAGGAVAQAALSVGVQHLTLFDLDTAKAQAVVQGLAAHFGKSRISLGDDVEKAVQCADGLINATPVGMAADPGLPLPERLLRQDLWVADLIYFPWETALLKRARILGARTMNGGGLVLFQAAEQFRLFTGIQPDVERMRHDFLTHLQQEQEMGCTVCAHDENVFGAQP